MSEKICSNFKTSLGSELIYLAVECNLCSRRRGFTYVLHIRTQVDTYYQGTTMPGIEECAIYIKRILYCLLLQQLSQCLNRYFSCLLYVSEEKKNEILH